MSPKIKYRDIRDTRLPMTDPSQTLLIAITKGDRNAFAQLYELYKTQVYNTILGYVQNTTIAEEITQEVFLQVYQKAGSFQGKSKVSTWLYRIATNHALNHINKQKRRPTSDTEVTEEMLSTFNHPGIAIEQQENARYLFTAIEQLPDKQKTAFILSYVEELPRQEVADIMETTLKAVEGLLQRAKTKLRNELADMYPQ